MIVQVSVVLVVTVLVWLCNQMVTSEINEWMISHTFCPKGSGNYYLDLEQNVHESEIVPLFYELTTWLLINII